VTTEPILLSLDLGTTNCKAVAFDPAGVELARAEESYPTHAPAPGAYEQKPADWLVAVASVLRDVAAALDQRTDRIVGLGLSGWGPGLVLLSADGEALNEASPTWQDTRSVPYGERLIHDLGAEWIGGGMPTSGFPAKLAWARDAWPELVGRTAWALGVKDFVLHWLTGEIATEESSGPYGDEWPVHVIEAAGWRAEQLPPVLPATDVGGGLLPERSGPLGLAAGLPVVMGLNDGASATLGAGCHRPGDGVVSLGTNGVLRVLRDERPPASVCLDAALFRYPFVDGLWVTGGFALSGGNSLRWLRESAFSSDGNTSYERLLEVAAAAPVGALGVTFLPYLVGRGTPSPNAEARAAFVGLGVEHGRGELVRAVLEGVAFALGDIEDALSAAGWEIDRLMVTGGGARDPLWRSIVAGALGHDVTYTRGDSNLGAAIVLAVARGVHADYPTAVQAMVGGEETPLPDTDLDAYREARARYRGAVEALYGP
jgi:sugar (pentulose or hexulose) kinase